MKTVLILQQFGLGDQIWSQTIAHKFIKDGYEVVWPVKNEYFEGLCRAYPKIKWVPDSIIKPEVFDIKEKIEHEGMLVAPIRWSDSYMKLPYKDVMAAKYLMYGMEWQMWKKYAAWERNFYLENELFKKVGLQNGEPYNVVNTRFGSGTERNIEIKCENGFRNIELQIIPGFSLFDWQKILMEAKEIHTVSTSLLYILEMLPLTCPIHLYTRKPVEQNLNFVRFLLTKDYNLHE